MKNNTREGARQWLIRNYSYKSKVAISCICSYKEQLLNSGMIKIKGVYYVNNEELFAEFFRKKHLPSVKKLIETNKDLKLLSSNHIVKNYQAELLINGAVLFNNVTKVNNEILLKEYLLKLVANKIENKSNYSVWCFLKDKGYSIPEIKATLQHCKQDLLKNGAILINDKLCVENKEKISVYLKTRSNKKSFVELLKTTFFCNHTEAVEHIKQNETELLNNGMINIGTLHCILNEDELINFCINELKLIKRCELVSNWVKQHWKYQISTPNVFIKNHWNNLLENGAIQVGARLYVSDSKALRKYVKKVKKKIKK